MAGGKEEASKNDRIGSLGANNRSYWAARFQQLRERMLSEDEWDDLIDKDPKFIKLKANPFPQFDRMLYIMQERGQLVPTLVPTTATMTTSPILHSVLPLRSIMKLLECANLSQRKKRYERRKDEDESNDGADEDDKEPAQKRKANKRGGRRRGACQVTRTGQALSCQG
ncbi:hypothetical protein C356_06527 [Cryptococcus neoformans c45]|nr:hypothetical protein C356_06527 [Cryptococcus neoformans var. grubii c45]